MNKNKTLKVFSLGTVAVLASTLAACGGASTEETNAVNRIILSQDGTTVTSDFSVTTTSLSQSVSWSSSNTDVVSFHEIDGTMYAVITRPSTETEVTLTASVGKATKDFTIYVNPVDVNEIVDAFTFSNSNATVYGSFDLATSYSYSLSNSLEDNYATYTSDITWTSSDTSVISIADGTATVVDQSEKTKVTLTASFTYNNSTVSKKYTVYAYHEVTPYEQLVSFYSNVGDGTAYNIKGYVLAKCGYSSSYGNGYVYVLDQTLQGGYYIYRASFSESDWNSLEVGTRVSFASVTNSLYNGLIEGNACTGSIITDDSELAQLTDEQLAAAVAGTAIDNQLVLGDDDALALLSGTYVTLTSWKVKSIGSATADNGGTLVTVTKNDVDVTVQLSKYGIDLGGDDATAIVNSISSLAVGDYVNIKGLAYSSNGTIINAVSDTAIVKTESDSDAAISTATAILAAVKVTDAAFKSLVATNSTIDTTALTFASGTAVSFALADEYSTVTYADGVFTFVPTDTAETVVINVTYTVGDYAFVKSYSMTVQSVTDAEAVAAAKENLELEAPECGYVDLVTTDGTYGTTITWAVTAGDSVASISDDKLITSDVEVTVTATITLGEATETKEFTFTVAAYTLGDVAALGSGTGTNGNYYYVEGYISVTPNSKYGNTYISVNQDTTKTLQIYGLYNLAGDRYDKWSYTLPVGTKVVLYGEYVSKYKEIMNAKLVSYEISDSTKAQALLTTASALFASAYSEAATVTLTSGVTATVTSGTSATIADGVVTITPTATADTVVITLSATVNETTETATVTFTTQLPSAGETSVTAAYTSTTSVAKGAADASANYAESLGLSASIFTVTLDANVGLYENSIRMYPSGNLVFTVADGYAITGITLNYDTSKTGGTFTVNGTAFSEISSSSTSDTTALASVSTVVINNTSSSNQVRFASIVITYVAA